MENWLNISKSIDVIQYTLGVKMGKKKKKPTVNEAEGSVGTRRVLLNCLFPPADSGSMPANGS